MNEEDYISRVSDILKITSDNEEKVNRIIALELPKDCNPLLALIHGDSTEVVWESEYDDPYSPSDKEKQNRVQETSAKVIKKIDEYVKDWLSGDLYTYDFTVIATHGHFINNTPEVNYEKTEKHLETKLLTKALEDRKKCDHDLADRNENGHKKISVYLRFEIYKSSHNVAFASGFIHDNSNITVSTWLNQH